MADLNVSVKIGAENLSSGPLQQVAKDMATVEASASKAGGAAGGFTVTVLKAHEATVEASASLEHLGETFADAGREAVAFGVGLVGLQVGESVLANITAALVEYPELIEKARITFETFTGSAAAAQSLVGQITGLGAQTPFGTGALLDTAQRLIALGAPAEEVASQVKDIATAVAAVGGSDNQLQGVALSLARIQETGTLDARVMRQLTTENIPAWQILAEAMGKPIPVLQEMIKQGQISSDTFIAAFHTWATSADVADVLAKRIDTVAGAMTVVKNQMQDALATALSPLTEKLNGAAAASARFAQDGGLSRWAVDVRDGLQGLLGVLDRIDPRFVSAAATLVQVNLAARLVVPAILGIVPAAEGAAASLTTLGSAGLVALLGPIGLVTIAVGALAVAYETDFMGMRETTDSTVTAINNKLDQLGLHSKTTATAIVGVKSAADYVGMGAADAATQFDKMSKASDGTETSTTRLAAALEKSLPDVNALKMAIGELGNGYGVVAAQADQLTAAQDRLAAAAAAKATDQMNATNDYLRQSIGQNGAVGSGLAEAVSRLEEVGKAYESAGQKAEAAIPGLKAFDDAMFGTSQQLAGVQLSIEERTLARLARRPMTNDYQKEAYLQELLKVEGLQRQVEFGDALRGSSGAPTGSGFKTGFGNQGGVHVTVNTGAIVTADHAAAAGAQVTSVLTGLINSGSGTTGQANKQLAGAR